RIDAATATMAFLGPRRLFRRRNWAWRYVSFLWTAAQAAWTSVVLSQGLPGRVRVDSRLPALSCKRGQRPAHERRWAEEGKRDISAPISAIKTRAAVIRRSTAARKG